jgi:hypothetical protein
LLRVIFANAFDDFYSGQKWPELFAIEYVQLGPAAELASELVKRRLEIILAEEDARKVQMVELATELFRFDERRAKDFEWPCRAATFGDVRAF